MLSIETQEAIVTKAFFSELEKNAGIFGAAWHNLRAGMKIDKINKAVPALQYHSGVAESELTRMLGRLKKGPEYVRKDQAIADEAKKQKTLLGTAAALGLGATGFGYYQYKRDKEHGQLAGAYPQVS
jgi:hypothetical protein